MIAVVRGGSLHCSSSVGFLVEVRGSQLPPAATLACWRSDRRDRLGFGVRSDGLPRCAPANHAKLEFVTHGDSIMVSAQTMNEHETGMRPVHGWRIVHASLIRPETHVRVAAAAAAASH